MRFPASFDPIDVRLRALVQEHRHLFAQLRQPAVAFDQLLSDFLILAHFDQLADGLPQALNRQCDIVANQLWLTDAQLGPLPFARSGSFATSKTALFRLLLDLFASRFHASEKAVGLLQNVSHQLHRCALSQGSQQTFLGPWIPKSLQGITHLATGNAQANMLGGDVLHLVRFVENHKIISEKNSAIDFFIQPPQQSKE